MMLIGSFDKTVILIKVIGNVGYLFKIIFYLFNFYYDIFFDVSWILLKNV